jgi:peptide deformylase
MKIITDLEKLQVAAEPLEFLTDKGIEKDEGLEIISKLKAFLNKNKTTVSIAAPQIGINKRIFCMRFQDTIKTFINPIITKKANYIIQPETFSSMPGKEILITRPEEITVVYYTDEFKYEENKLLGIAARVFEQSCQLLDGVTPDVLGLVSDIEEDGTLWDLTEEEMTKVKEIYKQYIETKLTGTKQFLSKNPELEKQYQELQFTEKVINGEAAFVGNSVSQKAQAAAALSLKKVDQVNKAFNRAQMAKMVSKSCKHKGKKK